MMHDAVEKRGDQCLIGGFPSSFGEFRKDQEEVISDPRSGQSQNLHHRVSMCRSSQLEQVMIFLY